MSASPVEKYKEKLEGILRNGFKAGTTDVVADWESLGALLVEDVLVHSATTVREWYEKNFFASMGLDCASRPKKTAARIQAKRKKAGEPEAPKDAHFKVNSDTCAFFVSTTQAGLDTFLQQNGGDVPNGEHERIQRVMQLISKKAEESGGKCYIRSYRPSGKDTATPAPPNITGFLFLYHPEGGVVVEVQVAHPFARYTFKLDSARRDATDDPLKMLNLWKECDTVARNPCFYNVVKDRILNPGTLGLFKKEFKEHIGQHGELEDILANIDARTA